MIDETKNKIFVVPLDLLKVIKYFSKKREYWENYNQTISENASELLTNGNSYMRDLTYGSSKEEEYELLIKKFTEDWHKFI